MQLFRCLWFLMLMERSVCVGALDDDGQENFYSFESMSDNVINAIEREVARAPLVGPQSPFQLSHFSPSPSSSSSSSYSSSCCTSALDCPSSSPNLFHPLCSLPPINFLVDVVLVGFEEGENFLHDLERDLSLQTPIYNAHSDVTQASSLFPNANYSSSSSSSSSSHLSHSFSSLSSHIVYPAVHFRYRVTHAPNQLARYVTTTLTANIQKLTQANTNTTQQLLHIPVWTINDILTADYLESGLASTLYILNPSVERNVYAYSQIPSPHYQISHQSCLVDAWVASPPPSSYTSSSSTFSSKQGQGQRQGQDQAHQAPTRFAWIDLNAGPVTRGPKFWGSGLYISASDNDDKFNLVLPEDDGAGDSKRRQRRQRRRERLRRRRDYSLTRLLVDTIHRSSTHLFTPLVQHFPLPAADKLRINVILIHEAETHDQAQTRTLAPAWSFFATTLSSLSLTGSSVAVSFIHTNFTSCPVCLLALQSSITQHTRPSIERTSKFNQQLNTEDMVQWLEHFDLHSLVDYDDDSSSSSSSRSVNVFVYDLLRTSPLLLDGHAISAYYSPPPQRRRRKSKSHLRSQSQSNSTTVPREKKKVNRARPHASVIAVQTRCSSFSSSSSSLSCNGRSVKVDGCSIDAVTRHVLNSVLSAAWGVAPSHLSWNPSAASPSVNYMWSVGGFPSSPFFPLPSSTSSSSFSSSSYLPLPSLLTDSIHRTVILSSLFTLMHHAVELHGHAVELHALLVAQLNEAQKRAWDARMNVMQFKVAKAKHHLELANFHVSMKYCRSARVDLNSLHKMLHRVMKNVHLKLHCKEDTFSSGLLLWLDSLSTPASSSPLFSSSSSSVASSPSTSPLSSVSLSSRRSLSHFRVLMSSYLLLFFEFMFLLLFVLGVGFAVLDSSSTPACLMPLRKCMLMMKRWCCYCCCCQCCCGDHERTKKKRF